MANKGGPLLFLRDVYVHFRGRRLATRLRPAARDVVRALDGVTLSINRGESVSIVGETGSGKSTLARTVLGLSRPTSGDVFFDGSSVYTVGSQALQSLRQRIGMVPQDPFDSLNPRQQVRAIVSLPLRVHGLSSGDEVKVRRVLEDVGLAPDDFLTRFPHEMSGGQRQRVAIARALVLGPELLVADEPASALDMSVRAQVLNLLRDLKESYGLTYLVIAHDLGMVRYVSTRVVVMYLGLIVEDASVDAVFSRPAHPYTQALMAAVPTLERKRAVTTLVRGEAPNPINLPSGCRFHPRCPYAIARCKVEVPQLRQFEQTLVACHRAEEIAAGAKPVGTEGLEVSSA